jgi:hypothetical protein
MKEKTLEVVSSALNNPEIGYEDLMAAVALIGFFVTKFDIETPNGKTLGEVVPEECYKWARAMLKAKEV